MAELQQRKKVRERLNRYYIQKCYVLCKKNERNGLRLSKISPLVIPDYEHEAVATVGVAGDHRGCIVFYTNITVGIWQDLSGLQA